MSEKTINDALKKLPGVDRLLDSREGKKLIETRGKPAVTAALRNAVDTVRRSIIEGGAPFASMDEHDMEAAVFDAANEEFKPRLRPVINATGVVVHTNLGRAPLAEEAVRAFNSVASAYSNLEYDIHKGRRGSRQSLVDGPLAGLVGCESEIVVNNNAGAVFLSLMGLARDREVIVSRGELVEIGGSFRIPDVMAASGAKMVEVGTTNKTKIEDYANAITDNTAMLLKVHRSNFYIRGFTHEAEIAELAQLADSKNLHLMVDLGSGCLVDSAKYGLPHESTPTETLRCGAHIVTFSGDKLLGGPQAGIIAGREDLVATLKKHPVHRALRVDKGTLAALEATLRIYTAGSAEAEIPVIAMIAAGTDQLEKRAKNIAAKLDVSFANLNAVEFKTEIVECMGKVGGGALADGDLPSRAVAITHPAIRPEKIFAALLAAEISVVGRIQDERYMLDVRTLWNVDDKNLADIVSTVLAAIKPEK